jgi:hypothetical protein
MTFRPAVAWISLLLQGVTAFLFHGLVLCVGPKGHTAVEWFAANDCCPPAVATTAVSGDRCCDCTDAPLLQPVADKRDGDRSGTAAPCAAILLVPQLEDSWSFGHSVRALAPPDELTARQYVVLQI